MSENGEQKNRTDDPNNGSEVSITINGQKYSIRRGRYSVVQLKERGQVNPAHELEQVKAGELIPLPDDGAVVIQGDEVFISHPRDSASS